MVLYLLHHRGDAELTAKQHMLAAAAAAAANCTRDRRTSATAAAAAALREKIVRKKVRINCVYIERERYLI